MKGSVFIARFVTFLLIVLAAIAAPCQVNTWIYKAHMLTERGALCAATGPDGRIYAIGGSAQGADLLSSVEAYDPAANSWTYVHALPSGRQDSAAVTGKDGRIYVIGGESADPSVQTSILAYDTAADSWTPLANIPVSMQQPEAAVGQDGRIYVIQGYNGSANAIAYAYDINSNSWIPVPTVPAKINDSGAAASGSDGTPYWLGGGSGSTQVTTYDSVTDVWTNVANMGTARFSFAAATGRDHKLYAVCGDDTSTNLLKSAEAYDPQLNAWSPVPDLNLARNQPAATMGPDGKVYVLGGFVDGGTGFTDTVEAFDPPSLSATGLKFGVQEGSPFGGAVAEFSDFNTSQGALDFTTSIDWGDGSDPTVGSVSADGGPGSFKVTGNHTYVEEGNYTTTIVITDADGESVTVKGDCSVVDALIFGTFNNFSAATNIPFTGVVTKFTDPNPYGAADDFTVTVFWGDGSNSPGIVTSDPAGGFDVSGTHTYAAVGSYDCASDVQDHGAGRFLFGTATVTPPPPAIVCGSITSVEGSTFNGQIATFTDADPSYVASAFSASIDWGDGNISNGTVTSNGSGGFNVAGNHAYAEDGRYTITVTVTVGGIHGSSSGIATVTDAPLIASGFNLTVKSTNFSNTVASFTDADPAGTATDYTAAIYWGDGKYSNGTVQAAGSGFRVIGNHSYGKRGRYTVTITIKDTGGATATATTQVNMGPVK